MEPPRSASTFLAEARRWSSVDAAFVTPDEDVCVVIPMFNEALVIGGVVAELRARFRHVLCVDDGSTDESAARALEAGATVMKHPTNMGQGAALQTGLSFLLRDPRFQYFVTFDADGQHLVGDASAMLEEARRTGVDVILGSRFLQRGAGVPRARRVLLRGAVAFTRLTTGMRLTDAHNGLRVISRRAASTIDLRLSGMAHASEIITQIGKQKLSCREFPVTIRYTEYSRRKGQSNINALNIAFDVLAERVRGHA
ncbi:MAG TPA: glycosyltransferase family 2 protein [Longimicrobiaceae bacterium]|nr:glycosyltransferase family 2 protein [Longimicrobiaceae bacterium]